MGNGALATGPRAAAPILDSAYLAVIANVSVGRFLGLSCRGSTKLFALSAALR
jgi:hypothetical protein